MASGQLPTRIPAENPNRRRLLRLLPLAVVAGLAILVVAMGWHRALTFEALVMRRADLDMLVGPHRPVALVAFIGLYIVVVAASIPGAFIMTVAGGVLFGWLVGGAAAVIGATIGATVLFLIARYALRGLIERRLGPRLSALSEGFRADAFHYLLFLRLVPAFPFFLVNLAPALAGVRLGTFVAATGLGIIPATFAYAFFGDGLDRVIAAQEAAYWECTDAGRTDCRISFTLGAVLTPNLLAALTALGVAALIPVFVRRWRARRHALPPPA